MARDGRAITLRRGRRVKNKVLLHGWGYVPRSFFSVCNGTERLCPGPCMLIIVVKVE